VLLPAATTDEKSLLARLERLESGGRGTPAPLPQSPPPPPYSGTNDFSERTRVPAPPDRKAARPPETAAPATASPANASPANASPATASPANASPANAPAEPAAPASAPPAAPAAAGSASAGPAPADSLRQNWGAVLDAVKRERRVAWILLSNASVLSLEDGMLTLGFPRDGDLKGFTTSGCDADLKRVLSTGFGLNVTVKGVTGVDPGAGPVGGPARPSGPTGPGPVAAGRASDPDAAAPARSRPRHDEPPPDDITSDEFAPEDIPPDEPDGDQAPVVTELTGMDLIQRELGGQVIGEIDD
jgi:DNA polymerase-3 subunit gamma/tau